MRSIDTLEDIANGRAAIQTNKQAGRRRWASRQDLFMKGSKHIYTYKVQRKIEPASANPFD